MNGHATRRARALLDLAPAEAAPAIALLGLGLLSWFSIDTLRDLHPVWLDAVDYSHGHLVLLLTGWLLFVEVRRKPLAPFVPSWAGTTCFFALMLVVVAGQAATTLAVSATAFPALWMAAVWAAAGPENTRRLAPRLAYLYIAMPIWTWLIEPLRRLTVFVVTSWIRAADMPAFIDGNLIHVPSGTFEVQGGCAGLRYAIISVALAAFSNLLSRRRWAPSVVVLASAVLLGLVGNWIRVFVTVAVGQSEMQNLLALVVRDHHTFFGWVLFAVFMIPLFYLDRILPQRDSAAATETAAVGEAGHWRLSGTYAVCALLALGIALNYRIAVSDDSMPGTVSLVLPDVPGWQRVEDWQDARRPQYIGAAAETASWYADGGNLVGAYVAHYPAQRQEHEAVFYQNLPQGHSGVVVARQAITADIGATIPFEELEVADPGGERRLVWVGLRIAGRPAANELEAKALQIVGVIRGRRDAQALVLTTACAADCGSARSRLSRYAAAAFEPLFELAAKSLSGTRVLADAKDETP